MPFLHKLLLVLILSAAFSASAAFAINELTSTPNDETSQVLRECGINPVNGEWIK